MACRLAYGIGTKKEILTASFVAKISCQIFSGRATLRGKIACFQVVGQWGQVAALCVKQAEETSSKTKGALV